MSLCPHNVNIKHRRCDICEEIAEAELGQTGPTGPPLSPHEAMILYAWVGEDELGSGEVGLKQATVPAGCVPMVACKEGKMDQSYIVDQLQRQSDFGGKIIRLCRFTYKDVLLTLYPGSDRKLGATGKFPDGKDSVEDEGELRFGIGHNRDYVHVVFGKEVAWIDLPPAVARQFAQALLKHAEEVER